MSKLQPYGRKRADSKREIQRLLDDKGKNFVDVAEAAGVTPQTVSATMNGYRHRFKRTFLGALTCRPGVPLKGHMTNGSEPVRGLCRRDTIAMDA